MKAEQMASLPYDPAWRSVRRPVGIAILSCVVGLIFGLKGQYSVIGVLLLAAGIFLLTVKLFVYAKLRSEHLKRGTLVATHQCQELEQLLNSYSVNFRHSVYSIVPIDSLCACYETEGRYTWYQVDAWLDHVNFAKVDVCGACKQRLAHSAENRSLAI